MSKLNQIDDEFCARHNIARSLFPHFAIGHGNARADILLLSERPRAAARLPLLTRHAREWESGNLKQQLDATGILLSRVCYTSLLPDASDGEYQFEDVDWYQRQSALGCERLLSLVAAMPRLRSVVLLGQEVQRAVASIAFHMDDYILLNAFDTDACHSDSRVQPLSVQYYQYCCNMEVLEQACWGNDLELAKSYCSTEQAPNAPVVGLITT